MYTKTKGICSFVVYFYILSDMNSSPGHVEKRWVENSRCSDTQNVVQTNVAIVTTLLHGVFLFIFMPVSVDGEGFHGTERGPFVLIGSDWNLIILDLIIR